MSKEDIVQDMIALERNIESLYKYFGEIFPDHAPFWNQIAEEENNHANLVEEHKEHIPAGLKNLDTTILLQTIKDIDTSLKRFKISPPTVDEAFNLAYLLEKNAGEAHYQAILEKKNVSADTGVFQTLNFADRDHAKRINDYILAQKYNS